MLGEMLAVVSNCVNIKHTQKMLAKVGNIFKHAPPLGKLWIWLTNIILGATWLSIGVIANTVTPIVLLLLLNNRKSLQRWSGGGGASKMYTLTLHTL